MHGENMWELNFLFYYKKNSYMNKGYRQVYQAIRSRVSLFEAIYFM